MTHGSLFSGIGGFDLAAQWMGWKNVFHCEINPFCQKILKYYWPNADSYTDIKQTDFSIYRGKIDVLSGGFPCQPFSTAGKRKGAEDDRYLWPEMLRAIGEIRPTYVIGENVAGLVSMVQPEAYKTHVESQINIHGEVDQETVLEYQQYVTETVCSDLESIGYSVQPVIIPACAVGAPHKRDRIWFIAYCDHKKCDRGTGESQQEWTKAELRGNGVFSATTRSSVQQPSTNTTDSRAQGLREQENSFYGSDATPNPDESRQQRGEINEWYSKEKYSRTNGSSETQHVTNTSSNRRDGEREGIKDENWQQESRVSGIMEGRPEGLCFQEHVTDSDGIGLRRESNWIGKSGLTGENEPGNYWENFPTQPPVCGGDDGLPTRLDGITFPKWRAESIKAYGNAVVPQVVLEIFKAIEAIPFNPHPTIV